MTAISGGRLPLAYRLACADSIAETIKPGSGLVRHYAAGIPQGPEE